MTSPKKPAAKKPGAKRKAPDLDIEAAAPSSVTASAIDLSKPPKAIAASLLALLPAGATKHDAVAKKLLKAFPLVKAELEHRSNALARKNESQGTTLPIVFRFGDGKQLRVINISEDSFTNIFSYLTGREIVNASIVTKSWLSVSRLPPLWETLDESCGLTNKSKALTTSKLIKLLGRPQFANLKALTIPYKTKLGATTFREIAKVCPHLESIDIGYTFRSGINPKDHDLMEAVERFPNLNSISVDMWYATSSGISSVARATGGQLLHLKISDNSITKRYLSDEAMRAIGTSCKNLKSFTFELVYYEKYYRDSMMFDSLTDAGIIALVDGCHCLETLSLSNARRVTKNAFVTILEMVEQGNAAATNDTDDNKGYALRKIELKGYPFVVTDYPFRIEDNRLIGNRFAEYMARARPGIDEEAAMSSWQHSLEY